MKHGKLKIVKILLDRSEGIALTKHYYDPNK